MDEIVISPSGDQSAVTAFRNTQFVVAWQDRGASSIKGRLLGTNGNPTGNEFLVNAPTKTNPVRNWMTVVECGLGFVIAWIERAPGLHGNVKLRIFDADTQSPGDEIQINTADVDLNQPPALAPLSDGGFIVVWADARPAERIRAQRFGADGARNGPDFRVNTVEGLHRHPMVTRLVDGNIVVGWIARVAGRLMHVRFQILGGETTVGGEQILDPAVTQAAMTSLDSGRFVIARVKNPGDGEVVDRSVVEANVFEANGAPSGSSFAVTDEQAILSSWPTVAALPGERILLAWTQGSMAAPAAGTNVRARIFAGTQNPLGQATQLNTTTGGDRFSLCTATAFGVGEGDNLFAVWSSQSSDGTFSRAANGRAMAIPPGGFA